MKKNFFRTLFAVVVLSSAALMTSCNDKPTEEPIDNAFENPRYMEMVDGKIYVTCYNPMSVICFNPETKAITGFCKLGNFHPEGIAAVGGKLYIASSSISDESGMYSYDNKLYVVEIATMKLVDSITVGFNPAKVKKLDNNHIVFNTWGDYNTDFGGTYILNTSDNSITDLQIALNNFDVYEGNIYGYTTTYNPDYTSSNNFYMIDGASHNSTPILTDWSANDGAYGISINKFNGDIIVTTDGNYYAAGDCYVFTNNGTLRTNAIQMGILPSKAVAIDADNLLVINEGSWGANNASVSRVNVENGTAVVDYFTENNGRGLGDVAQDMIIKNGKVFITVTFSNSIEMMNAATGASTRFATYE